MSRVRFENFAFLFVISKCSCVIVFVIFLALRETALAGVSFLRAINEGHSHIDEYQVQMCLGRS
jgi:hypothetical protein